jgi:hypothetical protein
MTQKLPKVYISLEWEEGGSEIVVTAVSSETLGGAFRQEIPWGTRHFRIFLYWVPWRHAPISRIVIFASGWLHGLWLGYFALGWNFRNHLKSAIFQPLKDLYFMILIRNQVQMPQLRSQIQTKSPKSNARNSYSSSSTPSPFYYCNLPLHGQVIPPFEQIVPGGTCLFIRQPQFYIPHQKAQVSLTAQLPNH